MNRLCLTVPERKKHIKLTAKRRSSEMPPNNSYLGKVDLQYLSLFLYFFIVVVVVVVVLAVVVVLLILFIFVFLSSEKNKIPNSAPKFPHQFLA